MSILSKLKAPSLWFEQAFNQPLTENQICGDCGHTGPARRTRPGRDDVEVLLWVSLAICTVCYVGGYAIDYVLPVFPGLIIRFFSLLGKVLLLASIGYTLWRLSTPYEACPKCSHASMIPLDSPKGRKVKSEMEGKA